jgi:hypothetical protein
MAYSHTALVSKKEIGTWTFADRCRSSTSFWCDLSRAVAYPLVLTDTDPQ